MIFGNISNISKHNIQTKHNYAQINTVYIQKLYINDRKYAKMYIVSVKWILLLSFRSYHNGK